MKKPVHYIEAMFRFFLLSHFFLKVRFPEIKSMKKRNFEQDLKF
nr:MAG TPA: hypothetical protein [Caudoviricetes sp.]